MRLRGHVERTDIQDTRESVQRHCSRQWRLMTRRAHRFDRQEPRPSRRGRSAATSTKLSSGLPGPSQVGSSECAHAHITSRVLRHDDRDHRRADHSHGSRLCVRQDPPGVSKSTIPSAACPGSIDRAASSVRVVACHRRVHAGAREWADRVDRCHWEQRARRCRPTHDAHAATSRGAAECAAYPRRTATGRPHPDRQTVPPRPSLRRTRCSTALNPSPGRRVQASS
jgi:hypothetical protein